MSQPQLILASGSPRRRQLLEEAGYRFEVLAAREGVEPAVGGDARELVAASARLKGFDVAEQLSSAPRVVLAADTVAEVDGQPIGKPADAPHAAAMMRRLSGRQHRVLTGVWLRDASGAVTEEIVETSLAMDELTDQWIEDYVRSEKWRGKAGGFGYQDGLGFVRVVQGSESNVVGLPMEHVAVLLASVGCEPTSPNNT
ncbi:Maf-like protein YhdE [Pseudobythopirellula maris]|uniref:dTTP/UTP pyrophosphatase n=1 Tax=Pseudobythopirellula maris TaxID=2527991 RepID=A0A5C5ZRA0_9BACT|nr:Maf family protein [Pseudobythopirellula maris]TWT90024.1 Maf-like protein YhdE [Pseudobythopirellula maris]